MPPLDCPVSNPVKRSEGGILSQQAPWLPISYPVVDHNTLGGAVTQYMSRFRQSPVEPDPFSVTWEFVPGHGAHQKSQGATMANAERAAAGERIHAVTITDSPPAIPVGMLEAEIDRPGIEPIVHFSCKGKNRNQLEALLHGMERAEIRNLLVMTGDYTCSGWLRRAKPVFELDAAHLLGLITERDGDAGSDLLPGRCSGQPVQGDRAGSRDPVL